jgi:predicted  nucleic acid-binding Zn-ribbon protein
MKLRGRGKRGDDGGKGGDGGKGDAEAEKIDLTDIDGLKALIQSITQATNPLGKIVEMIDDDLESMGKEYDNWTKVYTQNKEKMKDREKEIENELQGLYDKITSKDEQIKEKKAQIEAIKTQQMRNTKKIEK